jgi:hypothetical protein
LKSFVGLLNDSSIKENSDKKSANVLKPIDYDKLPRTQNTRKTSSESFFIQSKKKKKDHRKQLPRSVYFQVKRKNQKKLERFSSSNYFTTKIVRSCLIQKKKLDNKTNLDHFIIGPRGGNMSERVPRTFPE